MAKFIFKMQNILVLKGKLEEQEKINYSQAIMKLREAEERLDSLKKKQAGYEDQLREFIRATLDIMKINQTEHAIEIMKKSVLEQQEIVYEAERNVELARHKLNEAMKERKIYEKLRENEFKKFLEEINVQEQKEIDELVSFTYGNSKKSEERS